MWAHPWLLFAYTPHPTHKKSWGPTFKLHIQKPTTSHHLNYCHAVASQSSLIRTPAGHPLVQSSHSSQSVPLKQNWDYVTCSLKTIQIAHHLRVKTKTTLWHVLRALSHFPNNSPSTLTHCAPATPASWRSVLHLRPYTLGLYIGLFFCLECAFPGKYTVILSTFFKSPLKCHSHGEPTIIFTPLKTGTHLPSHLNFLFYLFSMEKKMYHFKIQYMVYLFIMFIAYCPFHHIPLYHSLQLDCKLHEGRIFLCSLMYPLFKIVPGP